MKKRISILACLVFFSLACVMSAARIDAGERVPVPSVSVPRVKVVVTDRPRSCAVVIAEVAVHLRESASPSARIIDHLCAGVSVEVLSDVGGEWWQVKSGEEVGYVRSIYLQKEVCK